MTKRINLCKNISTIKRIKGLSLFSSAGVAETYYKDIGIDIVIANELIEKRANLYQKLYPYTKMIKGNILNQDVNNKIKEALKREKIDILIATPPCQGVSLAGKNKSQQSMANDERNHLIFKVIEYIHLINPKFVLIENVPRYLKLFLNYKDNFLTIEDILKKEFGNEYNIKIDILDSSEFGVPQKRKRAFIKLFKKDLKWNSQKKKNKVITLRDDIGHLPSLESGEESNIKWHFSKKHNDRDVLAMKHTPTGQSAFKNDFYYPKKENGDRIKGFHNTYKRMKWNEPAHARTTNSGNIGSHNNVHPGILQEDGTYSDARTLTILETLIVSSLPQNWDIPDWATDNFIRTVIGEAIPPLMSRKILERIKHES